MACAQCESIVDEDLRGKGLGSPPVPPVRKAPGRMELGCVCHWEQCLDQIHRAVILGLTAA